MNLFADLGATLDGLSRFFGHPQSAQRNRERQARRLREGLDAGEPLFFPGHLDGDPHAMTGVQRIALTPSSVTVGTGRADRMRRFELGELRVLGSPEQIGEVLRPAMLRVSHGGDELRFVAAVEFLEVLETAIVRASPARG